MYRDKYDNGTKKQYEDIQQVIRRCHIIMEWREPIPGMTEQWVYHKGQLEWDQLNAQFAQQQETEKTQLTQEFVIYEE